MPGVHLNNIERKLKNLWDNNKEIPFLTGISIDDGTAIRGMKNCRVDFKYPITVFCGKNGSGKTTFLQLAALAFHHSERKYRNTFSDFLKKSQYDASNDNTKLTWYYMGKDKKDKELTNISVHKGQKKWMHYDRRPIKKVVVLPVSRTLPANEKKYNQVETLKDTDFTKLNPKYLGYLQKIMGRLYSEVDNYQELFSKCSQNSDCQYSCYNMGIGEKIICYILSVLQDIDEQSLIVIDEIEMGLHPEALSALAEVMQEIALNKKLQIFITSHSRDFLDALPREARIVVERIGNNITTINNPTTMYAISRISAKNTEEMVVYCEDEVAKEIIKTAVGKEKTRIICGCIGSKTELLKAVHCHIENKDPRKFVVIWDGDVTDNEIDSYFKKNPSLNKEDIKYTKLLGEMPPEKWILNTLDNEEGYKKLSLLFNIDKTEVQRVVEIAKSAPDGHDVFYSIGQEISEDAKTVQNYCCRALMLVNANILDDIKNFLVNQLNEHKGA